MSWNSLEFTTLYLFFTCAKARFSNVVSVTLSQPFCVLSYASSTRQDVNPTKYREQHHNFPHALWKYDKLTLLNFGEIFWRTNAIFLHEEWNEMKIRLI